MFTCTKNILVEMFGIREILLDIRATHKVFTNGCVKFSYHGWEISVAADGADIIAIKPKGVDGHIISYDMTVSEGGIIEGIAFLKAEIDKIEGE